MQISQHFSLEELVRSGTAARQGLDNTPDDTALANLRRLAGTLEAVRALVGQPLRISSGYRSVAVNAAVGGSRGSAHALGLAADFNVQGLAPRALAQLIADSTLDFDQLILEFDRWVHLGLSTGPARRQVLTARSSSGYLAGLV
ncbi:MAG: D-Ala-D-Ala carboxypeptidase family metallohydrolase [Pseudomonas sp.]|uniref:D-Ala-D-Ala carboxypeptidase family metallohydrolase n=1 Tax=Pseudomonas abieticivorans TaxID=2931382 RepID=UPI0020C0F00C|nr:D-Ala-D-Ala carboxypeptidase family metallohydrolase [Pseudomonas sp. PIA16]MDE1167664.1 D-Ala-D-Ala carboxypeptidase family metallohydrolase [Pseudomonas sp.]